MILSISNFLLYKNRFQAC